MVAPTVTFADGDEASGMATMLGGLLEENIRDYQGRARVARIARGDVVLTASDRDVSVTLSFRGPEVVVRNGRAEGAAALAGPWLEMAKLCSGQVNPLRAVVRRELTIEPRGRLDAVAAAGFVLSIPQSFYDDDAEAATRRRRQRRRIAVAVVVTTGAVVAVTCARRARRRRS